MHLPNQVGVASAHYAGSSNGQPVDLQPDSLLLLDINLTALGGTSPTIQFFWERLGADGTWYTIWSGSSLSAATKVSTSIGLGMETDIPIGRAGRLRWTMGGTGFAGDVNGAANSATQTLESTTGILAGDVLHFATANVDRTVASVTNGTVVVLTAAVNAADEEVVTGATPTAIFSYSVQTDQGK